MERTFWKALGPGLIWAGASVGVSHLVQSTRAGSDYGFALISVVVLANVLKYPFFEFGPRYAATTGESLLHGYYRLGKWVLKLYLVLTIATMFTIQAAVTTVTVGLLENLFPNSFSFITWTAILLSVCLLIIVVGKFRVLDGLIKVIIVVLTLSTVIAAAAAFGKGFHPNPQFIQKFEWSFTDIAFLFALVGWMPSAIDVAVWHSMWTVARTKETGYQPKLKEALLDFNIGYIGTAFLALCFLALGALVMYGTGNTFHDSAIAFSGQLVSLYTISIGPWAYYLIAIAALATMFSTTLTVLDAYPRVLKPTTELLFPAVKGRGENRWISIFWLVLLLSGTLSVMIFFKGQMKVLIDIATTLSFITAPVLGYFNLKVVTASNMPAENKPPKWLILLSWVGLVSLSGFAVYYIVWRIMGFLG